MQKIHRTFAGAAAAAILTVCSGCDFDPVKYFSRNACTFLNCDVLFFVPDMFPLSAGPVTDAGAAGTPVEGEDEDVPHVH